MRRKKLISQARMLYQPLACFVSVLIVNVKDNSSDIFSQKAFFTMCFVKQKKFLNVVLLA